MLKSFIGYLRLMRPANLITAVADIIAGAAAAGLLNNENILRSEHLQWLVISTICLYGGGVVLNDAFDAKIDAVERPERPIPSGIVPRSGAFFFGAMLLMLGVQAASHVYTQSWLIALGVALLVLLYDGAAKQSAIFGPVVMGLCRSGNLLLGMSAVVGAPQQLWWLGLIPLIYIIAVTTISRGEVSGGGKNALIFATIVYVAMLLVVPSLQYVLPFNGLNSSIFLGVFFTVAMPPLIYAMKSSIGPNIGKAVKAGVLGLIPLNAALTAGFAGWYEGLAVLLLLPLSMLVARWFAVT